MIQSKYCWLGWAVIASLVTACTIPNAKTAQSELIFPPAAAHAQAPRLRKNQSLPTPQTPVLEKQAVTYDIPIRHNKRVEKMIDFYLTRGRKILTKGIARSGRYLPMLQKELKKAGLPQDLAYLVATESNYNPKARSHAGAVGLWQFMKATGKKSGLHSNQWMDERLDPMKATQAAIVHLKYLYNKFGNWELSLAAYNAGEGRVRRAMRRAKAKNRPTDYWSLKLPKETSRYVADFMAVMTISKNLKKYGLDHIVKDPPLDLKKIEISTDFSLQEVAKRSKRPFQQLLQDNPSLIYAVPPLSQKKYDLYLPKEHELAFVISVYKNPTPATAWKAKFAHINRSKQMTRLLTKYGTPTYIRVRKGDSLWKLSAKHQTTVARLRTWNRINKKGFLRIGQKLKIYHPTWKVFHQLVQPPATLVTGKAKSPHVIRVKPGDTLSDLARKYRVSVKQLLKWNDLKRATALKAHQNLRVAPPQKI